MKSINIKTTIPGPKSTELLKEREESVARGISTAYPIAVEKGVGAVLTDIDGNSYIDLAAGISSLNVGHSPKPVVDALKKQLDLFINPIFNVTMHKPYIDLAKKLNQIVPGDFQKKSVFFNSGAEAIENAVKIARRYTGRKGIISFDRSFHGRTMLAMTLTGKVNSIKKGFGPLASDVHHAPYPYYFKDERTDEQLIDELKRLFQVSVSPEEVAAIILEPVQGDGGVIIPSKQFMQEIRAICDKYGIVLIADEIQTGFGRTGKMFAMEHFNCTADLTVMSKSIAAGIPLSAITGKNEIINFPEVKELGGTLSGNTLGCVAALEVIKLIENENLLERANEIGRFIKDKLSFESKHIGEIRHLGAMIGIEIVLDKQSKASHRSFVNDVVNKCFKRGVLFMRAADGDVIRLLPPLVITDEQLNEAMSVIVNTIKELEEL
ncbi:4-aminobutyrate--2-oxoglutarate transaminase [Sporosarcina sp. P16b]|uniref:aspartate aminotransferase family protein n=1 Tax=Sporosarcina sp. P16b TaxID=2048261 RepID=UPI000C1718F8|nr:aspartate aminotransferase family protein [Sporosarcina sp. P16b]PIC70781.1 4-aminobutyrate--2-oxoglutarate transaminase [Sporosarcina sp. P16b]